MKLISLSSDRKSFHTIKFHPQGLSIIVGDAGGEEGSANGTGKTLALNLVHHCLGAEKNKLLADTVPDWRFCLEFQLHDGVHAIERSGSGAEITLDGDAISVRELREWLNLYGPFELSPEMRGASFRALYRRFARAGREDRIDPVRLNREQESHALALTLYLLGTDVTLALRKDELRKQQLEIEDLHKLLRSRDTRLRQLLRSEVAPEARLRTLTEEINEMRSRLERMSIAKDYEGIREEADRLTTAMRELEEHVALIDYQTNGIASSLQQRPDIDREALLAFYRGLHDVFRPEALRHFEDVEAFHRSLAEQRRARLERERLALQNKRADILSRLHEVAAQRDAQLASLAGRHALSEYQSVVSRLAALEEDRRTLSEFINAESTLNRQKIELRQNLVSEDGRAAEYLSTRPLAWADERFRALVRQLYPQEAAGITLTNNIRPNRLRYDLRVDIQGQGSDGINAARVICFDWLLFMHGARHTLGHLWHDNGFFDHIDIQQRATWLELVLAETAETGKQYIMSLNTEQFEATLKCLPEKNHEPVRKAVIARLRGDDPKNKLLGVQVGADIG